MFASAQNFPRLKRRRIEGSLRTRFGNKDVHSASTPSHVRGVGRPGAEGRLRGPGRDSYATTRTTQPSDPGQGIRDGATRWPSRPPVRWRGAGARGTSAGSLALLNGGGRRFSFRPFREPSSASPRSLSGPKESHSAKSILRAAAGEVVRAWGKAPQGSHCVCPGGADPKAFSRTFVSGDSASVQRPATRPPSPSLPPCRWSARTTWRGRDPGGKGDGRGRGRGVTARTEVKGQGHCRGHGK